MSVQNKPRIEAYIGASGSGKGVSINRRLAELQPARLVIWDPRNEYGKHARAVTSIAVLVADLRKAGKGPIRIRFVPGAVDLAATFAVLCKAVFAVGDCVFVAEELSDVTTPSWAPPAWRRISTQGRHQGLHVLGASQKPTLIDKTFLGNCTVIRCFELAYDDDVKTMAKQLRVAPGALLDLVTEDVDGGGADIRCLEYERRARRWESVRLQVGKSGHVKETRAAFVVGVPQKGAKPARRAAGPT